MAIPLPYVVSEVSEIKPDHQDLAPIDQAGILIIGDRMGYALAKYAHNLSLELSKQLKAKVKIASLASPSEGLHRTLKRIKQKNLPKIVIYLGASEEFYEKKFYNKSVDDFLVNFDRYQDSRLRTLLYASPIFSKFIFKKIDRIQLNENIIQHDVDYDGVKFQKRAEVFYKIFELEFEELLKYTQDKKIHLIVVTPPINLDIRPKRVCENAINKKIIEIQRQALDKIKNNDFKSSFNILEGLKQESQANAITQFLLGLTQKKLGNLKSAYHHMSLANAFDCKFWRSNIVYNSILKRYADLYEVPLVDFQAMIYQDWNKNILFQDDLFPQHIYYEKHISELALIIKPFLKF